MAREFAKQFYRSAAWQNAREYALMRDSYLCVKCGRAAEEVHHTIFLTPQNINDPNISLNPDNLICLCHDCHTKLHDKAKGKNSDVLPQYFFDANGNIVPAPGRKKR